MCLCDVVGNRKVKSIPVCYSQGLSSNCDVCYQHRHLFSKLDVCVINWVFERWKHCVKGVRNWWKVYKGTMNGSHWRRAGEVNGKRGDNCGKVASKLMGRSMWTIGKLWEGHGVC